jgi:hypothetical protein
MQRTNKIQLPTEPEILKRIVIQGWTGMLFLLVLMMITDLIEFGMRGDFSALAKDPGMKGLWFIAVVACINVLGQIFVLIARSKRSRWAIFLFSSIYTLTFVGHQFVHVLGGEQFDIHSVLDISHHILGACASVAAYRLARQ